jgi:hypothetical protein
LPIATALAVGGLCVLVAAMALELGPFRTSTRPADDASSAKLDVPPPRETDDTAAAVRPAAPVEETGAGAPARVGSERVEPLAPAVGVARAADLYTIQASVIRLDKQGRRERLDQGAKLALGDWLSLEFEASKEVYLYVINEDELGQAYALFPLPDFDQQNPLPAGRRHEIPGRIDGKPVSWEVNTPGGREHLMLLASAERLVDFEAEMARLARPQTGQMAVPIPDELKRRLRGLGGISTRPETADPEGSIDRLFELAQRLAGEPDVVRGAWLRRFDLENPPP